MTVPNTVSYQGFEIRARSLQRRDSSRWSIQTYIRRNASVRQYFAANMFATREEAVVHCIEFGRRIIDGEIPEFDGLDLP